MTTTASDLERLRELARRFREGDMTPDDLSPEIRELLAVQETIREASIRSGVPIPSLAELMHEDDDETDL
jgi:O-phosphoseryl-tRNA(Cys) synthetase